jgi:hypothetical protein
MGPCARTITKEVNKVGQVKQTIFPINNNSWLLLWQYDELFLIRAVSMR